MQCSGWSRSDTGAALSSGGTARLPNAELSNPADRSLHARAESSEARAEREAKSDSGAESPLCIGGRAVNRSSSLSRSDRLDPLCLMSKCDARTLPEEDMMGGEGGRSEVTGRWARFADVRSVMEARGKIHRRFMIRGGPDLLASRSGTRRGDEREAQCRAQGSRRGRMQRMDSQLASESSWGGLVKAAPLCSGCMRAEMRQEDETRYGQQWEAAICSHSAQSGAPRQRSPAPPP